MLIPTPGLRRELERPLVGKIGLHEGDTAELAGVDRGANPADSGHQPRAVADGDGDAVARLERGDLKTLLQGAGDRLFGVDVLASPGDLGRQREMLLVGN